MDDPIPLQRDTDPSDSPSKESCSNVVEATASGLDKTASHCDTAEVDALVEGAAAGNDIENSNTPGGGAANEDEDKWGDCKHRPYATRKRRRPLSFDAPSTSEVLAASASLLAETKISTNTANIDTQSKLPKIKQNWDLECIDLFYEAIKQHGKDYTKIQSFITQKVKKNKSLLLTISQVRSFFYNRWCNLVRWIKLESKYLGSIKNNLVDHFVKLLYTGSTRFRLKLKGKPARPMGIKTPYCPALKKYFPQYDDVEELPQFVSELRLQLTPRRACDRDWLLTRCQNPNVQILLHPQKSIRSVLAFLENKWRAGPQSLEQRNSQAPLASADISTSDLHKSNGVCVYSKCDTEHLKSVKIRVRSQQSVLHICLNDYIAELDKKKAIEKSKDIIQTTTHNCDDPKVVGSSQCTITADTSDKATTNGLSTSPGGPIWSNFESKGVDSDTAAANIEDIKSYLINPDTDAHECSNAKSTLSQGNLTTTVRQSNAPIQSVGGDVVAAGSATKERFLSGGEKRIVEERLRHPTQSGLVQIHPHILTSGLNVHNAEGLTVGELYLITGSKETIELEYEIKQALSESCGKNLTWDCFLTLLRSDLLGAMNRREKKQNQTQPGYGARSRPKTQQQASTSGNNPSSANRDANFANPNSSHTTPQGISQQEGVSSRVTPTTSGQQVRQQETPTESKSNIVPLQQIAERQEFMAQLGSLRSGKKKTSKKVIAKNIASGNKVRPMKSEVQTLVIQRAVPTPPPPLTLQIQHEHRHQQQPHHEPQHPSHELVHNLIQSQQPVLHLGSAHDLMISPSNIPDHKTGIAVPPAPGACYLAPSTSSDPFGAFEITMGNSNSTIGFPALPCSSTDNNVAPALSGSGIYSQALSFGIPDDSIHFPTSMDLSVPKRNPPDSLVFSGVSGSAHRPPTSSDTSYLLETPVKTDLSRGFI